jgi:hypothetical protein
VEGIVACYASQAGLKQSKHSCWIDADDVARHITPIALARKAFRVATPTLDCNVDRRRGQRRKPGSGDIHGEACDAGELQRQVGQRVDSLPDPPDEFGVQAG